MKKITVLGGLGYIGSHLCRLLVDKEYDVTVLDIGLFGKERLLDLQELPNFNVIIGDARNSKDLADAIRGANAVINLAGLVGDPACSIDEEETWLHNTASSSTIAEVCEHYDVERLLYASSCSVYGAAPSDVMLNEGSYLNPISLYAKTKIDSEKIFLNNFSGISSIIRLATVFGYSEKMRFDLVANIFTIKALKEKKIQVFGGTQYRPFIHCYDAARAFLKMIEVDGEKINGERFNICSENISIRNLAYKVQEIIPCEIEYVEVKEDDRNYRVSAKKAKWLINYEPFYNISSGIMDMTEKIKENGFDDWDTNDLYYNHKIC